MFVVWTTIYSYSVVCEVPRHAIVNQRLSCLLYGQYLTPLEPLTWGYISNLSANIFDKYATPYN